METNEQTKIGNEGSGDNISITTGPLGLAGESPAAACNRTLLNQAAGGSNLVPRLDMVASQMGVDSPGSSTPTAKSADAEKEILFSRSSRMQRTPPRKTKLPGQVVEGATAKGKETPISVSEDDNLQQMDDGVQYTSPKSDYIITMRRLEEEELKKCNGVLLKMQTATTRQRNISNDVKIGLQQLMESMEVIASYRNNWLKAERFQRSTDRNEQGTPSLLNSTTGAKHRGSVGSTDQGGSKRKASSPAESDLGKRKKEVDQADSWTVVRSSKSSRKEQQKEDLVAIGKDIPAITPSKRRQRKRKHRAPRSKPEALLIKPGEGQTYAQVLKTITGKVNPESTNTQIKSVRRTRMGDILLEFGPGSEKKNEFCDALKGALGEIAAVRRLEPTISLEIRDIDCLTTEDDVKKAIKRDLKELTGDLKVSLTKINTREQRIAIVEIGAQEALKLLKAGRIKIGWVNCRILRRVMVTRCYACFGYGHIQANCKGPDRKKQGICLQCGAKGHFKKDCTANPKCFLCVEQGAPPDNTKHVVGSGTCQVFRQALDQARNKISK